MACGTETSHVKKLSVCVPQTEVKKKCCAAYVAIFRYFRELCDLQEVFF